MTHVDIVRQKSSKETAMKENWEHYTRNANGELTSIQLNTSIYLDVEEIEFAYPNIVFVKLKLKEPTETGLLSQNEESAILQIENILEAELIKSNSGVYVGRIISAGNVEFLYYLESTHKLQDFLDYGQNEVQSYDISTSHQEDGTWSTYQKLLYPTPKEWQMIENHHVCDKLKAAGRNLELPLVIVHKLQFISEYKKRDLIEELTDEGFQINDDLTTEDGYSGFTFERIDKPTYENIDALTLHLIDVLDIYDAKYDGWETSSI